MTQMFSSLPALFPPNWSQAHALDFVLITAGMSPKACSQCSYKEDEPPGVTDSNALLHHLTAVIQLFLTTLY